MNADQKKRAADLLSAWRATAYALHGDRMAALLQELVDAPEVLTTTNPAQISSSAEPPADVVRDAERYRWLRNKARSVDWSFYITNNLCMHKCRVNKEDMDADIDAAIERQGGE